MARKAALVFLLNVCLLLVYATAEEEYKNLRPIIGVLAQEEHLFCPKGQYIRSTYTDFVQAAGARAIPVLVGKEDTYYEDIINKTNGLLFPGGSLKPFTSRYWQAASKLFDLAIKVNDKGTPYPIWGSCLGATYLALKAINAQNDTIRTRDLTDTWNKKYPVTFPADFRTSKMFGNMPDYIVEYSKTKPVAQHFHKNSILLPTYNENKALKDFYQVTTTTIDSQGIEFVSAMEGRKYPFFYFQYHPEKNMYEWGSNVQANHAPTALQFSQHLGLVFTNYARMNDHGFNDEASERAALIVRTPVFDAPDLFSFPMDLYVFEAEKD